MNWFFVVILLLVCAAGCKQKRSARAYAKAELGDTGLKILTYGLPYDNRAASVIAKKYGFRYYPVAGCVVEPGLSDSVYRENQRVMNILAQRYGADWEKRFDKQVEELRLKYEEIELMLRQESFIKKKVDELDAAGNGLHFAISDANPADVYEIKAYGWGEWKGEDELVVFYKISVDLNKKSVKLLSSEVEKYLSYSIHAPLTSSPATST